MNTQSPDTSGLSRATFGGGCFWCLEPLFESLKGVTNAEAGYAGGHTESPTYKQVCSGLTGHAEVVQITFDPAVISYADLLDAFFAMHDPTTLNRQGADVGTQYRSILLTHDNGQKKDAERVIDELNRSGIWDRPIVTEIKPLDVFYPAESWHQEYFENNPDQPYCQAVINPKVAKFREKFKDRLK
ncbi:MAG TPA: peptide-methionine (S)-S-oxide reductase [bacterium]|nr:peptide-methionine (S)-S-oxide reductase [bacterium]